MAVLLSYHRLIEKDSRNVNYCWKASIIAALVVAIGSSLVISFSMASLSESFNEHCFMNATLFMERRKNDSDQDEFEMQANLTYQNYSINEHKSSWSRHEFCEYLTYTPLVHALAGVIWLALFTMHGHGGKGIGSIIPKPWRIVIPSLLFFLVCLISAMVSASRTTDGLRGLCRQFDQVPGGTNLECGALLDFYSLEDVRGELIAPDKNYYLLASFPWIWVTSYVCAAVILVLRIILVVDFQLIRVIISTVEPSRADDLNENQLQSYELVVETVSNEAAL
uniref:Putative conserved plasma membrane protein n=1 Tax=Culex tarsalis TaxID=7177 RepID=A0A1Q3G534_CULTA